MCTNIYTTLTFVAIELHKVFHCTKTCCEIRVFANNARTVSRLQTGCRTERSASYAPCRTPQPMFLLKIDFPVRIKPIGVCHAS